MEEEMDEDVYAKSVPHKRWPAIEGSPISETGVSRHILGVLSDVLSPSVVVRIVDALASARTPLIIASNIGRDATAPFLLAELCDLLSVPVVASCPTAPVLPPNHPAFAGVTYGRPPPSPQPNPLDLIYQADVILVLDADVPFAGGRVPEQATIFHIDADPLKEGVGTFHAGAEVVCRASSTLALAQLISHARQLAPPSQERRQSLQDWYLRRKQALDAAEANLAPNGALTVPTIMHALKHAIPRPQKTLILNEGVSNYPVVWEHLWDSGARVLTSGGSSLGWGLGASIGARLATPPDDVELVVLIVGDGSFLFGIPAASFWVAQNYHAVSSPFGCSSHELTGVQPFLTIVLNNGGWRVSGESSPCSED